MISINSIENLDALDISTEIFEKEYTSLINNKVVIIPRPSLTGDIAKKIGDYRQYYVACRNSGQSIGICIMNLKYALTL